MADGAGRDRGSGKRETEGEQLSEDLVRNILARLAPEELARAQLVCKDWKRLVRAQRPRQGEPWLLFTRTLQCNLMHMVGSRRPLPQWDIPAGEFPHCWAYDPARDRFFKVELPASMELRDLHSRGASMKLRHLQFCGTTPGSGVVAFVERGGFLGLADPRDAAEAEKDPSPFAMLWIGNPLRGNWQRVPCLGPARFTDVVIGRAGSFKVVQHRRTNGREVGLGQTRERVWRTRVFDSVTERWTEAAPIRTSIPTSYSLHCGDSCVGEGGLVYYLKAGSCTTLRLGLPAAEVVAEVMTYSVEKDEWSVAAPAAPLSHSKGRPWCRPGSLRIFEHQGAVKLSAGIPLLDAGKWGRATNWSHLLSIFGFYSYDAGAQGWAWDQASEVCLPDHFLKAEFRNMKKIKVGGGGGSGGDHVQLLCCKEGMKLFHPGMDLFKYEASSKRWSLQRNASYPMYPRRTHILWEDAFVAFHPRLDSGSESEYP